MSSFFHPQKYPSLWRPVLRQATQFEFAKMNPVIAARNTLGIALALLLGLQLGSVGLGIACSIGALQVAFCDGTDAYYMRVRRMLACSGVCSLALICGGLCGGHSLLANLVAVVGAFVAGFVVLFGATVSDLALFSLVMYLLFSVQAQTLPQTLSAAGFAFLGGLLQSLISILAWPFEPRRPELKALASLYQDLAQVPLQDLDSGDTPMMSSHVTQTQLALTFLNRFGGESVERARSLLSQAERLRLTMHSLGRLLRRLQRQSPDQAQVASIEQALQAARKILLATSRQLSEDETKGNVSAELALIENEVRGCREASLAQTEAFSSGVLRDLSHHMAALAGQLRSIVQLGNAAKPEGTQEVEATKSMARPWHLQLRSGWALTRANISFHSVAFRHACRLSLCVAFGEWICHRFQIPRAQWLPMTVVIVLKPDITGTFARGILRMTGTLLGLLLATALYQLFPETLATHVAVVLGFMFLVRWLGPVNYGVFTVAISSLVVAIITMTGVHPGDVIWARAVNTLLGGGLALLAYLLWPTWEKNQIPDLLAQMLDSYRTYLLAIGAGFLPQQKKIEVLQRENSRIMSRIARSNFEASLGRVETEPGLRPFEVNLLRGVQASSNRFAHSLMALEAACMVELQVLDPEEYKDFYAAMAFFLETLTQTLRGQETLKKDFPALRELFEKWKVAATAQGLEPGNILLEESDMMTNSLNTLRDQILKWRQDATSVGVT